MYGGVGGIFVKVVYEVGEWDGGGLGVVVF